MAAVEVKHLCTNPNADVFAVNDLTFSVEPAVRYWD